MNINQLRCFWELVNTGSFSAAGENLHISQSSVSKNILSLEKELELHLFERKGRKTTLTPVGLKLAKPFGEIIKDYAFAESLIKTIKAEQSEKAGKTISFAGIPVMANLGILATINSFSSKESDIELRLDIMEEDAIILSLQSGECDLVFCSSIRLDPRKYHIQKFSTHRFNIFLSSSSSMAARKQISLKDLHGEKLILLEPSSILWELCVMSCKAAGFTPEVILTTNRPEVAIDYIMNSNYMYMGLDLLAKERLPDSCRILDISDSPTFDYVFAWRRDKKQYTNAKVLLDYLKSHYKL